ncbi:MAG: hypothetical protein AUJ57_08915 [Zetaproteobacteria bacterium CG1_02_53_45]|nr:MAG: hypothetical protein AUJ57_08915 [Zetaproteobacteria bacterium CG1_02_53_45]
MIDFDLNLEQHILTLRPKGALSEKDFLRVAEIVDPEIECSGDLAGVIIQAEDFPGWENFAGMLSHFRFIRDHHQHIKKVAFVSDATVLHIFPHIAAHFILAEIKHFPFDDYAAAIRWIKEEGE